MSPSVTTQKKRKAAELADKVIDQLPAAKTRKNEHTGRKYTQLLC